MEMIQKLSRSCAGRVLVRALSEVLGGLHQLAVLLENQAAPVRHTEGVRSGVLTEGEFRGCQTSETHSVFSCSK